jgi:hypothetical protein
MTFCLTYMDDDIITEIEELPGSTPIESVMYQPGSDSIISTAMSRENDFVSHPSDPPTYWVYLNLRQMRWAELIERGQNPPSLPSTLEEVSLFYQLVLWVKLGDIGKYPKYCRVGPELFSRALSQTQTRYPGDPPIRKRKGQPVALWMELEGYGPPINPRTPDFLESGHPFYAIPGSLLDRALVTLIIHGYQVTFKNYQHDNNYYVFIDYYY